MAYKRKPKTAELVEKIAEAKGNISAVARAYSVSRRTVYGWIAESATAQQALADERETMVDTAESILYRRVAVDQDMTAVAYVLNNMREAKARGWGPRQEHTGADGGPVQHQQIDAMTDEERNERIRAIIAEVNATAAADNT